jgi:hypothetical protein
MINFVTAYNYGTLLWNTVAINLYQTFFTFPIPIILALMLHVNEHKWLVKITQNVAYVPHFISTVVMVGILNQILTLTGARGLVSLGVVILPIWLLFGALWIILPVSEGVLQYAVAPLFGVPLIMLFNMLGYNPVIALSCWAVMWPVGDCLPPTAVVGKASVMQMNYKGDYNKGFLKNVLVPALVVLALCTIVMIFNKPIGSFLGV